MTTWYNPAKDGEKFASITPDEFLKITWEEFTFRKNDHFYEIFGYAKKASPVVNGKEKGWTFEPQYLTVTFPTKEHESGFGQNKKTVKPPVGFQVLGHLLDKLCEPGKFYAGAMDTSAEETIYEAITTGKSNGDEIPEMKLGFIQECYLHPNSVEPEKMKDVALPEMKTKGKGGWSGGSGQKESEKLNDRLNFIESALLPDSRYRKIHEALKLEEADLLGSLAVLVQSVFN